MHTNRPPSPSTHAARIAAALRALLIFGLLSSPIGSGLRPALATPPIAPPAEPAISPPWRHLAAQAQKQSALPDWFALPQSEAAPDAARANAIGAGALPAWFTPAQATNTNETGDKADVISKAAGPFAAPPSGDRRITPSGPSDDASDHHTIYPNQITVTVAPQTINQCDPLTVTVVAANDAVTTTGVSVVVAAPAGLSPNPQTFNWGSVAPNAVLSATAVFSSGCSVVSGQIVVTLTQDSYPPIVKFGEYVVNPGAITVRKEPAVIQAAIGDVVTWTVHVDNTGYGTVYNVQVTDTLGAGLQYVAGLTSTSYISIPVGQSVSFTVSAQVAACGDLQNQAVATFGCPGQTCLAPQVAKSSIDLLPRFPDLDYALPAFNVNYCGGSSVFTIPITNTGDGTAYTVTLPVNLSPFGVSVAPPATYSGGAFNLPPIPPGGSYSLVFTLTTPANVCAAPLSGSFSFDLNYRDTCNFLYAEAPQIVNWQLTNAPGQLSVDKTMPGQVYRGDLITATVTVSAVGNVGSVVVTDQVPSGLIVVNPSGGVTFTLGGITYITWSVTGTTTLTPVFAVPDAPAGCGLCGLALTNVVTATAVDCQNCQQTATAQATTYIQCDEPEVRGTKLASGPAAVCAASSITLTNVYTFGASFAVTPTWGSLIFTESLTNLTYTLGSASVFVSNGPVSCTATFSEAIIGGNLVITNINPPCNPSIAGATLVISYTVTPTGTNSCQDTSWFDWSYLNLGVTGNNACAADGVVEEGVFLQTQTPQMNVSLSGLPANVASCGVYTVTLTAQRTSSVGAYDAVINVPTTTYAIVDVLGFGGAQPVFTQTGALGYQWFYSDAFASAVTATVTLRVQLRCNSGPAPLQGFIRYDSLCQNNDIYDQTCAAGGALAAPPTLSPLPLLTKFPELIYATGDVVTWTLIAKNTGAGPAHNVTLTDVLGSGLRFVTATLASSLGPPGGIVLITSTNLVTWQIPLIQPQETLVITYVAEIVSCNDLTNRLFGAQGCLGQVCLSGGPVTSVVELPQTILLNTNQTLSPIDTCFTRTVTATVRNAGLLSVYSATLTETLPVGLFYVTGSTEVSTDTLSWQPGPDPTISGLALGWSAASGAPLNTLLARLRPGQTVYLRFQVRASCAFEGGQLRIQTGYRDTCGNPYLTESSFFLMVARKAEITLDKIGQNLSRTSPSNTFLYGEPGEVVVFTITVANGATAAPAQLLVVTDALPSNLIFQSATPGYSGPFPGPLGGTITWSLAALNPGQTVAFTVTAVISQPNGCTITDTFNVAQVSWGCPDGCRLTLPAQQVRVRTRPVFDAPGIGTQIAPASLNVCGGLITVTLNNDGPPAYNVALTNTLPGGYVFSATVSSSAPPSGTTDLGASVVYTWAVLPSGLTTVTLAVRNATLSGACGLPAGPFSASLRYDDDDPQCPATSAYTASALLAINVVSPALTVDKAPLSQIAATGQTVTWTIRVTNTGSGAAFNVVITDVAGSTFASLTATNGGVVAGNTITWIVPSLAPGGVFTALVTALVTSTGQNRNVITATAQCDGGCVSTVITDVAYVTLGDIFDKGPAVQTGTVGSLAVFTFTTFSSDVENVFDLMILTDTLPAGLGYVSAALTYTWDADGNQGGPATLTNVPPTSAPALYAGGNVVWNFGTLTGAVQINGVITAVIQDVAAAYDGALLTNTLRLTYVDDGQPSVLTDTANVIVREPLLHLGKTCLTPYGCSGTLMEDNFNRASASPPTGWTAVAGTWNNANGAAQRSGGGAGNAVLVRSGLTAAEFSYSAMSWASDATSSRGLVFRYTANNYYLLRLRQADGGTNVELQEVTGGTFATLASAVFTPATNRWYHLEVRVEDAPGGLRIRGYVDGQQYFDLVDPTPRPAGSVGFYSNNCDVNACSFDDALVTRLNRAGCFVGAGDLITYTLVISNQARWPGYDLLITDTMPHGLSLVTYTLTSNDPTNPTVLAQPAPIPGATGVLTWLIDHLTPTVPYSALQHTALTLTVVAQVAPWITTNITLTNQAALSYDAWLTDTQPTTITRPYSGGSHAATVQTANSGITKSVTFAPPPTATLGTLVTYTLFVPAPPVTATLYSVLVTDVLDSRLFIEAVTLTGGLSGSAGWSSQQVTATFGAISPSTQALITITARISHEHPSPASDANAGDVITNLARMSHGTAPVTTSNVVSTVVGEPNVLLSKSVASSTGLTNNLDGLAYLTYTIRLTNTGSSPAYSVYVTDALPAGISVTAQFGGDSRSGPLVAPGPITWFVATISNVASANVVVLTYTARVSQALMGALLTNTVGTLYHSLTDTIPGVRPYTTTADARVSTGAPTMVKFSEPPDLRVGDLITYRIVFTIPAGLSWGSDPGDVLLDALPPGIWYITDSEHIAHTPASVDVTITQRVSLTQVYGGEVQQVVRWRFAPISSLVDAPTVVTLTFTAQAVGRQLTDTLPSVWVTQTDPFFPTNYAQLEYPWPNHISSTVTNRVIQPRLTVDKNSLPPPGSLVGAGDLITYTITITNDGYGPAYDIVISDVLPAQVTLVTYTLSSVAPPTATLLAGPPVSATGQVTWLLSALWGTAWNSNQPGVVTLTVVARVTDTIGANVVFTNSVALPYYDSQPGDGPGPYNPDEREYSDGGDSVSHRTADASIIKSVVPPTVTLGSVVTYVLTLPATPITATLYNVTVTDQLAAALQAHAVDAAPDGTAVVSGNAFTVTYASIPAGQQRFITITAVLSSPLGGQAGNVLTNVATLRHQDGGPTPSNSTQVTVTEPALALVKASNPPTSSTVGAGQTVTYTVRITNATGVTVSAAYDLVFSDALPLYLRDAPPALIGVAIDGAPVAGSNYFTGYNTLSGQWIITFSAGVSLPPGSALVITYTAVVSAGAPAGVDLINAAAVTWSSLPGATPGDRDYGPISDTTNIHLGYPTLDLTKSFTPTAAQAGGLLTYTIVVTAGGLVSATGVVITDALPANTTYVSCGPSPCGQSGGVVSWTLGTLNIGESRTVTLVVQVNSPLPDGTQIVNTAVVTSNEGITDTDTVTTVVGSLPILNLTKSSVDLNGAPLRPGDVLSYVIAVVNTGNAVATNVTVSDAVPANTTYVPGSIGGGDSNSAAGLPTLIWTINSLAPNAPVTLTFAVTIHLPLTNGLVLTNTAVVTSSEAPTPTQGTVTNTVTSSHNLAIRKSAQPVPAQPGGLLTYTLAFTVTGDEPVYGLTLSDTTPAHTTFVTATPPPALDPGAGNPGLVLWALGDFLPPASGVNQATGIVTLVVQLNSPLISGTQIVNTALLSDTSGQAVTDTVSTPVSSSHALAVSKSATPSVVIAGQQLTYTVHYTITGNEPAPNVVLTDTLPASVTLVSCAPACSVSGGVLTWSLGMLNPITSGQVSVVVLVNADVPTGALLLNSAAVGDSSGLTDTDQVTTPVQELTNVRLRKSATPSPVAAGASLTYTLAITNDGPSVARDVVVTDALPADVSYVSATPAPALISGSLVSWTLGALQPGQSAFIIVTVQVSASLPAGALITNTAVVTTSTPGDNPADNPDTVTTPVTATAELVLSKQASAAQVAPGAPLTYTVIVTNLGPNIAQNVIVTDTLPAQVSYVGAMPAPNSVSGAQLVWLLGNLDVGQSAQITIVVDVSTSAAWNVPFTNTARTTTDTPGDAPDNNIDDSVTTPVGPSLAIQKDLIGADLDNLWPNYVTFTIRITNTGPSPIANLPVEDNFDDSVLSYTVAAPAPDSVSGGLLVWDDLTAPAPHGYNQLLMPGQSFLITVTFRVITDIVSTVNVATVREGARDIYDNPANNPEDDAEVINVPTAVTLRAFYVAAVSGYRVTLAWETETEVDNFAFRLYRAPANELSQAMLIGEVPAAMSGALGASYTFDDNAPTMGVWWYWLADVDTAGRETVHSQPTRANVGRANRLWLPVVMRSE